MVRPYDLVKKMDKEELEEYIGYLFDLMSSYEDKISALEKSLNAYQELLTQHHELYYSDKRVTMYRSLREAVDRKYKDKFSLKPPRRNKMGTRGTVKWIQERHFIGDYEKHETKDYLNIYNHWDSYPEGLGRQLAEFISEYTIVNDISLAETRKIANGFDDLCLLWLCEHKGGEVGGVYALPADFDPQEYNYIVKDTYTCKHEPFANTAEHKITIRCEDCCGELVFEGTPEEWKKYLDKEE